MWGKPLWVERKTDVLDFEQQRQELEARLYAALVEATEAVSQK